MAQPSPTRSPLQALRLFLLGVLLAALFTRVAHPHDPAGAGVPFWDMVETAGCFAALALVALWRTGGAEARLLALLALALLTELARGLVSSPSLPHLTLALAGIGAGAAGALCLMRLMRL